MKRNDKNNKKNKQVSEHNTLLVKRGKMGESLKNTEMFSIRFQQE